MTGKEIKTIIQQNGIKLWQVADKYGLTDGNFSKRLRHDFTDAEAKEIFDIINELKGDSSADPIKSFENVVCTDSDNENFKVGIVYPHLLHANNNGRHIIGTTDKGDIYDLLCFYDGYDELVSVDEDITARFTIIGG